MLDLGARGAAWFACILPLACSGEVAIQILPGDDARADSGCEACALGAPALSFSGPYDRVEGASSSLLDLPQDFAIEAWVFVESFSGGHGIFNRWVSEMGDIELTFGTPEIVADAELPDQAPVPSHTLAAWGFIRPGLWVTAHTDMLPSAGKWHHVASSYGAGSLKLYVDGSRWATGNGTDRIPNPESKIYIGATSRSEKPIDPRSGEQWWPPIRGFIAEVRMSGVDRYPTDFVPASRLEADAATIALWHLDEGTGTTAIDSGPNRLSGQIVNAVWARAPAR
jgi:hypothetical protein